MPMRRWMYQDVGEKEAGKLLLHFHEETKQEQLPMEATGGSDCWGPNLFDASDSTMFSLVASGCWH